MALFLSKDKSVFLTQSSLTAWWNVEEITWGNFTLNKVLKKVKFLCLWCVPARFTKVVAMREKNSLKESAISISFLRVLL